MKNSGFLVLVIFLLSFSSCEDDRLKVDVSDVQLPEMSIKRLEQDLFKMDTSNVEAETRKLEQKYGSFYSIFISRIINNGGLHDSSYAFRVRQFISDRDMRKAYEDCQQKYPDTKALEDGLEDAFRHYRHYFPGKHLPEPVTMMSGFNQYIVPLDSTLAIGLEMYLGSENEFYKMLQLPRYKTNFMDRQNIVPDAIRTWMIAEFPYNMNKSDFLSEITYMGKIMYLCDALMPEVQDTLKIQYTGSQMDYCLQNEFNLWSYFAAQKVLYTTDQAEIMKFTSDGPFTTALSKESPPRIGYWIGWQIIRQYMKRNPEITIPQLMAENDAQMILAKSKYKPGK